MILTGDCDEGCDGGDDDCDGDDCDDCDGDDCGDGDDCVEK